MAMETIETTVIIGSMVVGGLLLVYCVVRSVQGRSKVPLVEAGIGLLGGASAGVAQFAAARLAMRVVALAAGLEPSLTLGGNLFILAGFTISMGMPAGLVFVLAAPHLAGGWRPKGLGYGGVLFLIFFPVFFGFGAGDLR